MDPAGIIERSQWDFFWIPADATFVDRPELLYVRCPRDLPLLNCVTRTRAATSRLPGLVEEVQRAHAGVTSRWLVRDQPLRAPLESTLAAAGYASAHEHVACILEVDRAAMPGSSSFRVEQVRDRGGLRDWYAVADAVFGTPADHPEHELDAFLAACTGPDARVHRFVAYEQGRPVSCAGMTSFASLRFGYLWAGGTLREARGRGAYRSVLHARIALSRRMGLDLVGLYARVDSSAPIVRRLGFRQVGTMAYWDCGPGTR